LRERPPEGIDPSVPDRLVDAHYEDPLDRIWLTAALRIGLRIERSAHVWASSDGRGTLLLGEADTLDRDDCLAQMIFHELCHSLIQGPDSFDRPDWGLDNESDRDLSREHACLRLQALLAGRHGLRALFAPTTEHRAFYDALAEDPLGEDESSRAARRGALRARRAPWAPHLEDALAASAAVATAVAPFAEARSLFARASAPPAHHPSALPAHAAPDGRTCGDCAWRGNKRCAQAGARVDPSWPACERFESALECQRCAACCRESYDVVELRPRERFVRQHPSLVRREDGRVVLPRVDGRCVALSGDIDFVCTVYDDRPRTCREFARGGANCLEARRRIGLSL
jgi:hypothetical protein